MNEFWTIMANMGFPAVMCCFFMFRLDKTLNKMDDTLERMKQINLLILQKIGNGKCKEAIEVEINS